MERKDGGPAFPRVLEPITRDDMAVMNAALNDITCVLRDCGFNASQRAVALKIGLTAYALQAADLDHRDKSLSGPLNAAIDRAINETIAELRSRSPESAQ